MSMSCLHFVLDNWITHHCRTRSHCSNAKKPAMNWYYEWILAGLVLATMCCNDMPNSLLSFCLLQRRAEPPWAAGPETVRYPAPRYNAYVKWAFLQATCVRQKKVVAEVTHTHYKLQKYHKANRSVPKKQTHVWIVIKTANRAPAFKSIGYVEPKDVNTETIYK